MIKGILKSIKEWFNEDIEETYSVKYISEEYSFAMIKDMISKGENVEIFKKAWKKKSGLDYPIVCYKNEICTFDEDMERHFDKSALTIENISILLLLEEKPYDLSEIDKIFRRGKDNIYQGIKVLLSLNLIETFQNGRKNYYCAANDADEKLKLLGI